MPIPTLSSKIPPLTARRSSMGENNARSSLPTPRQSPPRPTTRITRASSGASILPSVSSCSSLASSSSTSTARMSLQTDQTELPLDPSVNVLDDGSRADNIRVLLRLRPISKRSNQDERPRRRSSAAKDVNTNWLEIAPDGKGVTLAPLTLQEKRFGFDRVFPFDSSQEDIFQDAGLRAVENAVKGYNGCIFAYGQTGSGKTFTMLGGTGMDDTHALRVSPLRGMIPRVLDHLFRRLDDTSSPEDDAPSEYKLSCSYLEIYNEKVFDLLEDAATQKPKTLREDAENGVYVQELSKEQITSEDEAMQLLQKGAGNRHMASTDMNRESSRSHAVFTLYLSQVQKGRSGLTVTRRSMLHLVDLAGSEKQRQTKVAGEHLKEAAQINKSLSALGNVIMSLVDVSNGQKRHVHYRDSKLTFLLRDSLGGNAVTTLIATVSVEDKYFSETLSTLKFAQRAKFIQNRAVQNEDAEGLVPMLKQEVARLRQRVAELSSSDNQEVPPSFVPQESKSSLNRWEPALDVMQNLLKASGADNQEGGERSGRLEMLLYRMICRFEEHRALSFASGQRASVDTSDAESDTSSTYTPKQSHLPAPRLHYTRKDSDHTVSSATLNALTQMNGELKSKLEAEKKKRETQVVKTKELEAENELVRQELCDLLENKAMASRKSMEDRSSVSTGQDGVLSDAPTLEEIRGEPSEDFAELLNTYRVVVEELMDKAEDKVPMLSSPEVTSDEEDVSDDDDALAQDEESKELRRERRRISRIGTKLQKKMDRYQETVGHLEKQVQSSKEEQETALSSAKFADFQVQQMKELLEEDGLNRFNAGIRTCRECFALRQEQVDALTMERNDLMKRNKELQKALEKMKKESEDKIQVLEHRASEAERKKVEMKTKATHLQRQLKKSTSSGTSIQEDLESQLLALLDRNAKLEAKLNGGGSEDELLAWYRQEKQGLREEKKKILHELTLEDQYTLVQEKEAARDQVNRLREVLQSDFCQPDERQYVENALDEAKQRLKRCEEREMGEDVEEEKEENMREALENALCDEQSLLRVLDRQRVKRQGARATVQSLLSNVHMLSRQVEGGSFVRHMRDEARDVVKRRSVTDTDFADAAIKRDNRLQQLAMERATLSSKLHRSEAVVGRLERELERSRNSTQRNLAAELMFEM